MTANPKEVGAQIRALLLSLRAPDHPKGSAYESYATDELRREALDYAGFCWLVPGEIAPGCCCDWDLEHPDVPRKRLQERIRTIDTLDAVLSGKDE